MIISFIVSCKVYSMIVSFKFNKPHLKKNVIRLPLNWGFQYFYYISKQMSSRMITCIYQSSIFVYCTMHLRSQLNFFYLRSCIMYYFRIHYLIIELYYVRNINLKIIAFNNSMIWGLALPLRIKSRFIKCYKITSFILFYFLNYCLKMKLILIFKIKHLVILIIINYAIWKIYLYENMAEVGLP